MAMTFKKRKDGKEKASFAVYFDLTREEVAVVEQMAHREGKVSCRQLLKRIARQAIFAEIAANS